MSKMLGFKSFNQRRILIIEALYTFLFTYEKKQSSYLEALLKYPSYINNMTTILDMSHMNSKDLIFCANYSNYFILMNEV